MLKQEVYFAFSPLVYCKKNSCIPASENAKFWLLFFFFAGGGGGGGGF